MSKTIYKYPLEVADVQDVMLPDGAQILSVAMQGQTLCLWAMVDTDLQLKRRRIVVYGTGHPFGDANQVFIGTVLMDGGSLVWHVFEQLP